MAAGSFWSNFGLRFQGGSSSNGLDELLEKGPGNFTLEEVLLHEQCIQEAKYMNQQLCDYLSQPDVVKQLIQYVINVPPEARNIHKAEEVGGGIDAQGGITTAASLRLKAERAQQKAAAEAASTSAAAADQAGAAATPATSASAADASDSSAASASADTKPAADSDEGFLPDSDSDDDEESEVAEAAAAAQTQADLAAENAHKFPYLASELFACEVPTMLDAIFEDGEALSRRGSVQIGASNTSANGGPLDPLPEDSNGESTDSSAAADAAGSAAAAASASSAAASAAASSPSSPSSPATAAAADGSSSSSDSSSAGRLPLLDLLLSFLDQPAPLDPAHASYFRKVMVVLIQRKYDALVRYLSAHGSLSKFLKHIGLYSIMECLIMIGWDDGLGGQQDVSWLVEADLTGQLISKLAPHWELEEKQPDVLINASRALVDVVVKCPAGAHNPLISRLLATPCLQQLFAHMFSGAPLSLSNALSIVIVLVQRYANRMDLGTDVPLDEGKADQQQQQQQLTTESDAAAANGEKTPAATEGADGGDRLPEPFHSLVPHLSRILRLLDTEAPPEADWSYGRGRAFGETRLKVVELILVLVRCKVAQVEQIFVEENLMHKLLDAFFLYPWNNMLHGLVESIIRTTLEYLQSSPLKAALFTDAHLVERVLAAYEANTTVCAKGAGYRLGYMGHLLRTAEVIEQYLSSEGMDQAIRNRAPDAPSEVAAEEVAAASAAARLRIIGSPELVSAWSAFVSGPLASEAEAQRVVLPSMGHDADDGLNFGEGGGQDDLSGAEAELAGLVAHNAAAHGDGHGGQGYTTEQDYFADPDDTSSLGMGGASYDYSAQMEATNEWADFSAHFSEAAIGESPNGSRVQGVDDEEDGAAGGGGGGGHGSPGGGASAGSGVGRPSEGGLSSAAAQRKLLEFAMQPDEDEGPDEADEAETEAERQPQAAATSAAAAEEEQDDWANFDSVQPASAAASESATGAASTNGSSALVAAAAAPVDPPAAAPVVAADDDDDFPVEFPK